MQAAQVMAVSSGLRGEHCPGPLDAGRTGCIPAPSGLAGGRSQAPWFPEGKLPAGALVPAGVGTVPLCSRTGRLLPGPQGGAGPSTGAKEAGLPWGSGSWEGLGKGRRPDRAHASALCITGVREDQK